MRISVHAVTPPYPLKFRREAVRLLRSSGRSIPQLAEELEDVPLAVELRDGGPVSELSQAGVAATSGVAVVVVVRVVGIGVSAARCAATSRSTTTASLARSV
jgi:hypothetical protein